MAENEKEEALSLQKEFEWVLKEEVHAVLNQLHTILIECVRRFPFPLCGNDSPLRQEKFIITTPPDQKSTVSLSGDSISYAEIAFKIQRQQNVLYKTKIQSDHPWKLHQMQDAGNHLQQALCHIDNIDKDYAFTSSEEVLHILGNVLNCLQRGRSSLIVPRKRTIDDLIRSRNMKSLNPNLPEDLAISFYIQSHKLMLAVYQLSNIQGTMKFDTVHGETSVPWLNEVLVLFTVALQLCQQLKDKISVFAQHKDFTIEHTRSASEQAC